MNKYEQQIHYFDKFKEWIQEEVNARDYLKSLEQLEAIEIRLWEIQNSMEDSEIKDEIIKIILNIEDRLIYIREEKYTEPFWEDKWDWFDKECGRIFGCKFEDYYKVKD